MAALKRPTLDAADRRTLGMLLLGAVLLTLGVLWAAWLLGLAVTIFHLMAGG